MTTLTIRFFIDDKQVDEVGAEVSTEIALRGFIEDAKRGLEEAVYNHERVASGAAVGAGLIKAFERLRKDKE